MRIGPFYFDTKEIILLCAAIFIGIATFFGWDLWRFEPKYLLTLTIIFLMLKGLLPSTHNEAFFIHAVLTVFLTLFIPFFQVLIFYFVTFGLMKLIKVI